MPKKRRKKYTMTDEQREAARQRMLAMHEKKNKKVNLVRPLHSIFERVYMAGWKHNKALVINEANQMSVQQADDEVKRMLDEAFDTKTE